MYKGTYEGDEDEINFVRTFNLAKDNYRDYLNNFTEDFTNYWMVRVTTRQISHLNGKKVFTRADCYLVEITQDISDLLSDNSSYLSEEILELNHIIYKKIPLSGVSVKMASSDTFQILKAGPETFKTLFGSYELGAGASLFCMRLEELEKNIELISGWGTTPEKMADYYSDITNGNASFYLDQDLCKKIKTHASGKIKDMIDKDTTLQLKIFNGVYVYDEPYSAHFLYHGNKIKKLTTIPFYVTTGSGRSHGDYTIVLKPAK